MNLSEFERLVGVLTIATAIYAVATASSPRLRGYLDGPGVGVVGLVVALGATIGSLTLSEGYGLVPCELCWYQRIFMYPLPILIGLGFWKRSVEIRPYVISLAAIGAAVSVYHLVVQWVPNVGSCSLEAPCSSRLFDFLGFVSIPAMALVAFAGVIVSMVNWRSI